MVAPATSHFDYERALGRRLELPLQSEWRKNFKRDGVSGQVNVILVEDEAHRVKGHRPTQVVQLANGLASAGHSVTVFVSSNVASAGGIPLAEGVSVATYPHWLQHARSAIERTRGYLPARLGHMFRQLFLVTAVRVQWRKDKRRAVVLELTMNSDPIYRALLSPLRTHWAVYRFATPTARRVMGFQWLPRAVNLLRRRAGGSVRIVANNRSALDGWASTFPWLEAAMAPIAMIDETHGVDVRGPAPGLGDATTDHSIASDGKAPVALAFGFVRPAKDLQTVIEAYEGSRSPGRLVLAGMGVDAEVQKFQSTHPDADLSAVSCVDGYLDAEAKRAVFDEADIAIVSFVSGVSNDSGTLCDAVARGLPVCCSGPGAAATDVLEYGLGVVFPSGDVECLCAAIRTLASGGAVSSEGADRFRADRDAALVASSLLRAAFGSFQESEAGGVEHGQGENPRSST